MSVPEAPSVSVVIPALDEAEEIEATLASLRGEAEDVVVVDGGSLDDTRARAIAAGARVLASEAGRAAQMNAGAAATTGEVLLFLHADTHLPAGWAGLVREAVRGGAVAGRFDVALRGRHPLLRVVERAINVRSRWSRIYTGDQAPFVRRDVFERLGGFERLPLMEDVALARRLKRAGPTASLRARVSTSARRWETDGVVRTIVLMWGLRLAYFAGVPPGRLARFYRVAKRSRYREGGRTRTFSA